MSYLSSDKAEAELAQSIKKATSPDETAPKQKHIRRCIVYTWDHHSSALIWSGLKVQPILADEVQTFKALIMVHKILKDGHPVVLKDGLRETAWIETCSRSVAGDGSRGYGSLIRNYVELLLHKLNYHRQHPEFNGTFEYEEYISLKNIDDPNEGYETISDLMSLQDRIDSFQKRVFAHFRPSSNNECRIAALVPLVEESYGIYKFITSMLRAMHRRTDAVDALSELRARYNSQHYALLRFYYECSNLRYLTSLISVPKLPQDPPSLIDSDTPSLPARPKVSTPPPAAASPEPVIDFWSENQAKQQREYEDEQRRLQQQRDDEQNKQRMMQMQQQREFEEQQRLQAERERQQQEELMRQQMQRHAEGRVNELEREILAMRNQFERDQMLLEQYDRRVKALEDELGQLSQHAQQRDASKDELIKSLQDQISMWKNKYEALAKLYSQLRQEHLDLLGKYKSLQLQANNAKEATEKLDALQAEMRAKNMELADLIRERDRAKNELTRLQGSQQEELERLRRELRDSNARVEDLGKNKGAEVTALLGKFNREKAELERSLTEKQALIDEFLSQLELQQGEAERIRMEKDEEIAIMQAGMDECLQQLADLQQNVGSNESTLQEQVDRLESQQSYKLNEILDSVLQTCIQKVKDGVFELEAPGQHGNENATPELTLTTIEKASISSVEFMSAFSKFLDGTDSGNHTDAINCSLNLAEAIVDVMVNCRGITRLSAGDEEAEDIIRVTKASAEAANTYFLNMTSTYINMLPAAQRPEIVIQGDMRVQEALMRVSRKAEDLIAKGATDINKLGEREVGDLVEQEMSKAARAIEEASAKIQALLNKPANPEFSATDLQVHQLILNSVLVLTNAIANLIKCATASQQEIVAQGRGTSSKAAFYKKNNRWTEGLISAAKAVAVATNLLVEAADGVISKTHSLEQLIVASNEVSAATAQLVAASRVKATFASRTQERLELAAKAVKEAANGLVKQVKQLVAKQSQDENLRVDFNNLSVHDFKRQEMEQQVKILKLDADLVQARRVLAEMR
ncbi:ANTH-domain-containing protein [Umbelopsis sp. AD052]|nr:ANTH-domain-containing protein [Umbelopsis sp. AD052]